VSTMTKPLILLNILIVTVAIVAAIAVAGGAAQEDLLFPPSGLDAKVTPATKSYCHYEIEPGPVLRLPCGVTKAEGLRIYNTRVRAMARKYQGP
jgi:hypothetical protein